MVFTIALALATAMALPLIGYVAVDMAQAQEQAAIQIVHQLAKPIKPGGTARLAEERPMDRTVPVVMLALAALTLAVFVQVRHHEFVDYDDYLYVSERPEVRAGLSRAGVAWAWSSRPACTASSAASPACWPPS